MLEKEEIQKINQRLERLEQEIADLKENHDITRVSVNLLLDWADDPTIQKEPLLHQRE